MRRSLALGGGAIVLLSLTASACPAPGPGPAPTTTGVPSSTTSSTTTAPATTAPPATTSTAPATTSSTSPSTTSSTSSTTSAPTTSTSPHSHDCPGMSYTPVGALPPATPMFCMALAEGIPTTFQNGTNSWVDDFNHGASMAAMGSGYREYGVEVEQAEAFRHNQHWMPDVQPRPEPATTGGHYLRPDRTFRFRDGVLVVEMDVAAGIDAYEPYPNQAWPEIVVSTAGAPSPNTARVPDEGYAMGHFPGADTVGVRLQPTRVPIAGLFNTARSQDLDIVRTWEKSFFQTDGATNVGGGPFGAAAAAWRTCAGTDPDTNCRDRFRWELRRDSITLYVNGVLYWQQTGIPVADQLPDSIVNGDVYVYAASWISTRDTRTYRFHWDRFAVNP